MINIKEIRNKILSIQNTCKITKAMEMIAVSKMHYIKEKKLITKPYNNFIYQIINRLISGNIRYNHSYLNIRDIKCVGYLVIGTDRGLVGNLNTNLFKRILIHIEHWNKKKIKTKFVLLGSKIISLFKTNKIEFIIQANIIGNNPKFLDLLFFMKKIIQEYDLNNIDRLFIVYNKFITTLVQNPTITQILPICYPIDKINNRNRIWDYIYEPNYKIVVNTILQRYLESQIYQNIIENLISEQAARMITMKSATDNSNNIIKDLHLKYNKARQANITQEITEIIAGSSAV